MDCCPPAQWSPSQCFVPSYQAQPPPPPYPGYPPAAYYNLPPSWSPFYGIPPNFSGQLNIFPGADKPQYAAPYAATPALCPCGCGLPYGSYSPYDPLTPRYQPPPPQTKLKDAEKPITTKKSTTPMGGEYIYPKSHLIIMAPTDGTLLWESKGEPFKFGLYQVSTRFMVRELIEQLGGGKDHTVSEVRENGDGTWTKLMSIAHKSDQAKELLESGKVGWTEAKGTDEHPLWVVLHK